MSGFGPLEYFVSFCLVIGEWGFRILSFLRKDIRRVSFDDFWSVLLFC